MKTQANGTPPKETNKVPVTNPEEMEIHKLPDEEFETVLRTLSKPQENTDK